MTGEDTLAQSGADGSTIARYVVTAGGRTDRPCPLENPFPLELGARKWVHDPVAHTLCHLEDDARVQIRIDAADPEPTAHKAVIDAIADAFTQRATDADAVPPSRDPRVSREGDAPPDELALTVVGLRVQRPDDGYVWRVAQTREGRWFDALVRVFPVFPEVQLLVYRHDADDIRSCDVLARRQVARGPWRVSEAIGDDAPRMTRGLGRFLIVDRCAETPNGILDVRVASAPAPVPAPRAQVVQADLMWTALQAAARAQPRPPLPATIPARDFSFRWAAAGIGASFPDVGSIAGLAQAEVGVAYARRNGVFARAAVGLGYAGGDHDARVASGVADVGVALAVDPSLTLVLALGLRDEVDPVLVNRSFSGSLELYSDFHRPDHIAWALRVVPFQLASRQPAVAAAPFVLAWDAVFPSGVMVGVDLRWVDRPIEPREGWPGAGLVLGARIGIGDIRR